MLFFLQHRVQDRRRGPLLTAAALRDLNRMRAESRRLYGGGYYGDEWGDELSDDGW